MLKLIITACAESRSGKGGKGKGGRPDAFTRAQANQLANETGAPYRNALKVVRANAGGRTPFSGSRAKANQAQPGSEIRRTTYNRLNRLGNK